MSYIANEKRYSEMKYNKCGNSGLKLPAVSLGLWHNFGDNADGYNMKKMCFTAFDNGITHFDLANNYGPEAGAAERNFGKILHDHMSAYRDEMIIGFTLQFFTHKRGNQSAEVAAASRTTDDDIGLDAVFIQCGFGFQTDNRLMQQHLIEYAPQNVTVAVR